MEERINVYFGNSDFDQNVIHVMPQGEVMEYIKVGEDCEDIPMYDGEVESWLNRTDMIFKLFSIRSENLELLTKHWTQLVKDSFDTKISKEEIQEELKKFISLANS